MLLFLYFFFYVIIFSYREIYDIIFLNFVFDYLLLCYSLQYRVYMLFIRKLIFFFSRLFDQRKNSNQALWDILCISKLLPVSTLVLIFEKLLDFHQVNYNIVHSKLRISKLHMSRLFSILGLLSFIVYTALHCCELSIVWQVSTMPLMRNWPLSRVYILNNCPICIFIYGHSCFIENIEFYIWLQHLFQTEPEFLYAFSLIHT